MKLFQDEMYFMSINIEKKKDKLTSWIYCGASEHERKER